MTINGSSVNTGGTITYNGFAFSGPRVRWTIRSKPVLSEDGRTTLANQYTLSVRYLLTDDSSGLAAYSSNLATSITNGRNQLQKARTRLSKNGQRLIISGMGFDLDLNRGTTTTHTAVFDTRWGPNCELDITPVGDGVVWEINWTCVFTVPECVNASGTGDPAFGSGSYIDSPLAQGNLESLVFNVGYNINYAGLTNRIISGKLTAAIHRNSTTGDGTSEVNKIPHTADELWELIAPTIPPNFRRIEQNRQLSADKRELSFTVVDQELPSTNDLPDGVLDMHLDHTVSVGQEGIISRVNAPIICSFNGYIEVYKGYPLGTAFDKVVLIMQQRIDSAKDVFEANDDTVVNGTSPVYITAVSMTESMYGPRRLTFSFTYVILSKNNNSVYLDVIGRSALFEDVSVAGVSNANWQASLQNTAWDNRGLSQLAFDASQDRIVGPCEGAEGSVTDEYSVPVPSYLGGGSLVTGCPQEGYDYLAWDSKVIVNSDHRSRTHTPLQSSGSTTSLGYVVDDYGTNAVPNYRQSSDTNLETINSYESASTLVTFCLKGQGHRLGKPVEIPKVNLDKFHGDVAVSGVLAPSGKDRVTNRRFGKLGTCPIYHSTWYICYTYTARTTTDLQTILAKIEQYITLTTSDTEGQKVGGSVQGL